MQRTIFSMWIIGLLGWGLWSLVAVQPVRSDGYHGPHSETSYHNAPRAAEARIMPAAEAGYTRTGRMDDQPIRYRR